jgi:hypothetical protein
MKVTPKFDRREEGLRALASMIADAYRKRKTFHNDEEPLVSEDEVIVGREPDGENGFKYTEAVRVEALLRRRKHVNSNALKSRRSAADHERSTIPFNR